MTPKKPKATHRETIVHVRGKGRFPLDMLRYDACVPDRSVDANAMMGTERSERVVRLRRYSPDGGPPEAVRWLSFGWTVLTPDEGTAWDLKGGLP